jgi:fructose 1,6-bisphosphate aldolase/phosphatase
MSKKITVSAIKADIGGFPGHSNVHPQCIAAAEKYLKKKGKKMLVDFHVTHCGDDLQLIMTHRLGINCSKVHKLAWDCFMDGCKVAKKLKLYGAGQDLLADSFSGNIRGMGPGIAELEFTERKAEPIVVIMMDKTEPGAFNFPIFKMFADPFNTAGLVIDPNLHKGFRFEVWDIKEKKRAYMECPEEMYNLLCLIGAKSRYVIKNVYPKAGSPLPLDEPVANISTEKLYFTAGKYVGKDDPVGIVRCQSGLPALGEALEPFALPYLVSGWMRGSHNGPLLPVSIQNAKCTRFDGPPRVIALGFELCNGKLIGPADLFNDVEWNYTRRKGEEYADYMRRHGPFEPHRLPLAEMEYTTLPHVLEKIKPRFKKIG